MPAAAAGGVDFVNMTIVMTQDPNASSAQSVRPLHATRRRRRCGGARLCCQVAALESACLARNTPGVSGGCRSWHACAACVVPVRALPGRAPCDRRTRAQELTRVITATNAFDDVVAQLAGLRLVSSHVSMFGPVSGVTLADQVAALAAAGAGWQSVPLVPLDFGNAFRAPPLGAPRIAQALRSWPAGRPGRAGDRSKQPC